MSEGQVGRPPHDPTERDRRSVEMMVAAGITHEGIAACIGIAYNTLLKHYEDELKNGKERANATIAGKLFQRAMNDDHPGCTTSAIFWLKTRAGWKEPQEHQITGKDGKDLTVYTGVVRDDPGETF